MKRLYVMVMITIFLFGVVFSVFAGDPYAPKADVPKNVSQDDPQMMSIMMINAAKVPERSAVEIPPYQGARVFQTKDASEMTMNNKKYKTLPYIKLLSIDPPEKIVAWYKEQLKGYTYEDVFGSSWVFWKGKGKFNGLDMRQRTTIQNVTISKAIAAMGYDKDMKGTKSVIEVTYEPKQ